MIWVFSFKLQKKIEDLILLVAGEHQTPASVSVQSSRLLCQAQLHPPPSDSKEEIAEQFIKRSVLKEHQAFEYVPKLYREE